MDSIQIDTGEKRIAINDDPERVIVFNPHDVIFAEKFYRLIGEFETQLTEYQNRSNAIDAETTKDANGLPANMEARLSLLRETCGFIKSKIDYLFGEGTSQKAFGDATSLDMFSQFFDGMTPFIKTARVQKIAQYMPVEKKVKPRKRK